ncbi:23S rRNA (pseudouridine(1915)-N(3))-methyltransferase RlmH [Parasphingopyxis sp.]|uniref:23S rRNA (pseudouridine(1915)-N(3))-methyltransferase RlmH n=1 Tax=Parasphingopyxis sp. TaxID=1920299 RepID=UPI00260EA8DD|nr:23S rRNA (pseudouridine(1915)-N(3))-methyltransferase RlmH [Parasphingopyxis sp.]
MTLHIIARGKIGRSPEAELVDRYVQRIGWDVKMTELPDTGGKVPPAPPVTKIVTLDEKGRQLGSVELARQIGDWRDQGIREIRFLIGATNGLTAEERASADLSIAFGNATWPHLMVRAMLAEQLWRARSILANHPYHREG